ncbi:MAG TPA: shikimate kinase, partial [Verrucomicrobia bacterium]|nr:shikimate kinase [Verrucomicrobiota bacterium]
MALVGFMGTGKSTVGRRLAQMLEFLLVDADHMIERAAGKPITEIFEKDGELRFREYEFEILESIQKMKNTVISTGGGFVVPPQNMELLKQNCLVVCL